MRRWAWRAVAGVVGVGAAVAFAQQPGKLPATVPPAGSDGGRTVAVIYNNVPITQEEFGKFLTDRGGAEKLELFVNKRIIEAEAAGAGISVTQLEMEAALKQDMDGITVSYNDFVKVVLPRYGKTLYEWMEDVVRPRLLLSKMCKDEVKVTDDDLKIQYERLHGEKRRVQMIIWPLSDKEGSIPERWNKARQSQEEFDAAARAQPNPSLAIAKGHVQPIARHLPAEEKIVEETAFKLKVGEVSEALHTSQGWVVLKLHEVVPPNPNTTFEKEKAGLHAAAYDQKLQQQIPKKFAELKQKARPDIRYVPPKEWQAISQTTPSVLTPGGGGLPTAPAPGPKK
jgi:hypothetical protein